MSPRQDDWRLRRGHRFALRRATAALRRLPDFYVLGSMKSGTSSLFSYICQHPGVARPFRKETHYLTLARHHGRGPNWYRAHFPLTPLSRGKLTGEATPDYLFHPEALDAIARMRPRARLIVILRDPVHRALSHYRHEVRMGREPWSFADAVLKEEARLEHARQAGPAGQETLSHAAYIRRGHYADQLEEVFRRFPREQVVVLWHEDLAHAPQTLMARVFSFLGLETERISLHFAVKNASHGKVEFPGEVKSLLEEHFRPHDERLSRLLNEPVPWRDHSDALRHQG